MILLLWCFHTTACAIPSSAAKTPNPGELFNEDWSVDDWWTYIGTYHFNAGRDSSVIISDDANKYVIADAIKFEPR